MEILLNTENSKRVIGRVTLKVRQPKKGYMTIDGKQRRISKILHTSKQ